MSQPVRITKLAVSENKGVCKGAFNFEFIDDVNRKHAGNGRFACVKGSAENWPGLIQHDLTRRLGRAVEIHMPQSYEKHNPKFKYQPQRIQGTLSS